MRCLLLEVCDICPHPDRKAEADIFLPYALPGEVLPGGIPVSCEGDGNVSSQRINFGPMGITPRILDKCDW